MVRIRILNSFTKKLLILFFLVILFTPVVDGMDSNTDFLPMADTATKDWTPFPGAPSWDKLVTGDGDVSYIHTSTVDDVTNIYHADIVDWSGKAITKVRLIAGMRSTAASPDVQGGCIIEGIWYPCSVSWPISNAWANFAYDWDVSPATGVAWTPAEVNNLTSSLNYTVGVNELRCTQIYFKVYYNHNPTIRSPSPADGETGVSVTPPLQVVCVDVDGDTMSATWSTNHSGSWHDFATNSSISNNTLITQTNDNFSAAETTYWWSVNVSDVGGRWTNESYHFVTGEQVTANFDWTPASPYEDQTVTFTDTSTGNATSWLWNFGDGGTSTQQNPTHVYTRSGRFNIRLTATGATSDNVTKSILVADDGGGGGGGGGGSGGTGGSGDDDDGEPATGEGPSNPFIPNPEFDDGFFFTVDEIFQVINVDELPSSNAHIRIVFMDSGVYPRTYNGYDLGAIEQLAHPAFGNAIDELGHGTWVANVISWGKYNKLPNLEIISYKCFGGTGNTNADIFLEALEEVKQLKPHVVSISAGAFGWPDDVFGQKVQELTNSGIIVVAAVGNNGPGANSILSPANSRCTIGVGAIDPLDTFKMYDDDYVPSWSGRGPVEGVTYVKPDCVAPGYEILGPYGSSEAIVSGTSMSTPFVAVGLATVYAINSGWMELANMLWWWEGDTKQEMMLEGLEITSVQMGDVDSFGHGIVDFKALSDSIFMMSLVKIIMAIVLYACIIGMVIYSYKYYIKGKKGSKKKIGIFSK